MSSRPLQYLSAKNLELAGIHVGLDALADQPVEKLRKQLEVNLVAQLIVTKVGYRSCCHQCLQVSSPANRLTVHRRASVPWRCTSEDALFTLADRHLHPAM